MMAAEPALDLYTSPSQTPQGATPLLGPIPDGDVVGKINAIVADHGIDAFWPQYSARRDLTGVSIPVHAAAAHDVIALVDDKTRFAEWLATDPMRTEAKEIGTVEELAHEIQERRAQGRQVCVKPVIGVNGNGYWKLVEDGSTAFLTDPEPREIGADIYVESLIRAQRLPDAAPLRLLVMDWLPGPEVSVDMLCWNGRPLIHAARTKLDANHQRITSEHVVVPHADMVSRRLDLHGIVSMQYRLDTNGEWHMLEVNPRPAGGSIHSEDAGFGLITAWAKLVAGTIEPDAVKQTHAEKLVRFRRVADIVDEG